MEEPRGSSAKRYIVFVGNLGYNVSTEALARFFSKGSDGSEPSVRLLTHKGTGDSRGAGVGHHQQHFRPLREFIGLFRFIP